jgi:outer membrane protein TolC
MKTRIALLASFSSLATWVLVAESGATAVAEAPTNLHDLLVAARQHALPVQNQRAAVAVAEANQAAASSALWPRLSATAGYTRNQYDVTVTIPRGTEAPIEATIQPLNQLEGTLQLDVPLLDVAARRKVTVATRQAEASQATIATTARAAERETIAAYYSWLGGEALRSAGDASLRAAQQTLEVTQQRSTAGLATELDVAKARASVARANRALAQAALTHADRQRTRRPSTNVGGGHAKRNYAASAQRGHRAACTCSERARTNRCPQRT